MSDPYEVLGLKRGATFKEAKAAYRRLAKKHHPDTGGNAAAFIALEAAFEKVLADIEATKKANEEHKSNEKQSQSHKADHTTSQTEERERRQNQDTKADVEDELDRLRREAAAREEARRAASEQTSSKTRRQGQGGSAWNDLSALFRSLYMGGLRGLAILISALMGLGALLLEFNVVGILILLGAVIGLVASKGFSLKKNGLVPLGFILIAVSLVFVSMGPRRDGLRYVQPSPVIVQGNTKPKDIARPDKPVVASGNVSDGKSAVAKSVPIAPVAPAALVIEPQILRAAPDSILKIVGGIPYQLLLRTGRTTHLVATVGKVAQYNGGARIGGCVTSLDYTVSSATAVWADAERMIKACDASDAVMRVTGVE